MSHLEDSPQIIDSTVETSPVQQDAPQDDTSAQQQTPSINESPSTSEKDDNECVMNDDAEQDELRDQFTKHMKLVEEAHADFLNKLQRKRQKHDCCNKLEATQKKVSDLLQKLDAARESADALLG